MILVTGGAGYIGSHTCLELLRAGQEVVVFDNFCNSHPESLKRVESITGKKIHVVEGDIRDQAAVESALRQFDCRSGDVASCYADPAYAAELLNWRSERNLDTMCVDAWRWQSNNPNGFR